MGQGYGVAGRLVRHDGPQGHMLGAGRSGLVARPALGQVKVEPTFSKAYDAFSNPAFG